MPTTPTGYHISLPQFEGPFDLLLFFIERDEIDIADLPIARITDDFLGYIREARALDLNLAGDFIVVAATLVSIKARLLLPRVSPDEVDAQVDPRQELVDRLIEYKRYRSVLEQLRALELARSHQFGRPFLPEHFAEAIGEARAEAEWESVTLYRLARAFERVLRRQADRESRPVHRVVRWPYTVEDESARIQEAIARRGRVGFGRLFGDCVNRVHAIVTFLALLELVNAGTLAILGDGDEPNSLIVASAEEIGPPLDDPDYVPAGVDVEPELQGDTRAETSAPDGADVDSASPE